MRLEPRPAIALRVDEIPCGQGRLQVGRQRMGARSEPELSRYAHRNARKSLRQAENVRIAVELEPPQQGRQRCQSLAEQHDVRARVEIMAGRIGSIRSRRDDPAARASRHSYHLERSLAHLGQAHLAQEIEIVLVEDYRSWRDRGQLPRKLLRAFCEHGIEQGYVMAGLA